MPTYKNLGPNKQILDGKVIEPRAEICSLAYYDQNEVQLLKTSDKPYYNPLILSEVITENKEVIIPE